MEQRLRLGNVLYFSIDFPIHVVRNVPGKEYAFDIKMPFKSMDSRNTVVTASLAHVASQTATAVRWAINVAKTEVVGNQDEFKILRVTCTILVDGAPGTSLEAVTLSGVCKDGMDVLGEIGA